MLPGAVVDGVRPTASRVREALFSLVGHDLDGERFLDAFGGSGLVAFEAWSRGAAVTCVERDPARAAAIRRSADALGAAIELRVGDARTVEGSWDVVFVDPPYADPPGPILAALAGVGAWVWVLEHATDVAPPEVAGLALDRTRVYGGSALSVYGPA